MNNTYHLNPSVAERLYARYLSVLSLARTEPLDSSSGYLASPITSLQLQTLIDVAFWASLVQEEGRSHGFSLVLCPKESTSDPFIFESGVRFEAGQLAKLAPALTAQDNSIGVWLNDENDLSIWGFTPLAGTALTVRVHEPGQLLVSFDYGDQGFTALVSGLRTEFVDVSYLPPNWVSPAIQENRRKDHKRIAEFMRSHGRGGTLLLINKESSWMDSIRQPVAFLGQCYEKIKNDVLYRDRILGQKSGEDSLTSHQHRSAKEDADNSLGIIGRMTALDGATLITFDLEVLAFGAKIKALSQARKPDRLLISEPFENSVVREIGLSELGGTRHQSAAQFVFDQKDAIAVVASQDKKLSVLGWEKDKSKVTVIHPAEFVLL